MHLQTLSNEEMHQIKGGITQKKTVNRWCANAYINLNGATSRTYNLPNGQIITIEKKENNTMSIISNDAILNVQTVEPPTI
jgi:hypothetical protein